ncbi:MAG TPA: hypothetical protein VGJ15_04340 [Pirellulales bacterium]
MSFAQYEVDSGAGHSSLLATRPIAVRLAATLAAVGMIATTISGCTSQFDIRKSMPWSSENFEAPTRIVVFWNDGVQNKPQEPGKAKEPAMRGMGGRVFFYGKNPNKSIKVDGELIVYGWDETNRDPKNMVPDRKFVFTEPVFKKLYSKNELGDSYSIWLPWDQVGNTERKISLFAKFTSTKSETATSETAQQILHGPEAEVKTPSNTPAAAATVIPAGATTALPGAAATPPANAAAALAAAVAQVNAQNGVQVAMYQGEGPAPATPAGATQGVADGLTSVKTAGTVTPDSGVDVSSPLSDKKMSITTIPVTGVMAKRMMAPPAIQGGALPGPAAAQPFVIPAANAQPAAGAQSNMAAQPNVGAQSAAAINSQLPAGAIPASMVPGVSRSGAAFTTNSAPTMGGSFIHTNAAPPPIVVDAQGRVVQGAAIPTLPGQPIQLTPMIGQPTAGQQMAAQQTVAGPSTRSGYEKPRVLGEPIARLDFDRDPSPQSHGEPAFYPAPQR